MKVKLVTTLAGPQGVLAAGAVVDLDDAQAMELVRGGYAHALQAVQMRETATAPPVEVREATPEPEPPKPKTKAKPKAKAGVKHGPRKNK